MVTINDKTYSASEHEPKTIAELLYRMELMLKQTLLLGGLNYKGIYDSATVYSKNDAVVYAEDGKGYVHVGETDTTGVPPTDTSVWKIYVSGVPGVPGKDGRGVQSVQIVEV